MITPILTQLQQISTQAYKALALLIDPDQAEPAHLDKTISLALEAGVDLFFVGGSLITGEQMGTVVRYLKRRTTVPVVLFPGSNHHIEPDADALLLLCLISGRNPDFLIGQHVVAAPLLKRSGLELLPTGYILVDGGAPTTVSYVSNTQPIPADKLPIAACTALAGQMLGLKLIYLDGGSGARQAVPPRMIAAVRREIEIPLIVGGGIRTASAAADAWQAGADVVVIGNAVETRPELIVEIGQAAKYLNRSQPVSLA